MLSTSARSFVDTNILVYAHDASAADKHERARDLIEQLWRERTGVLSTQVLQELYVRLRKARNPLSPTEARQVVSDYVRWEIVVNTAESVLAASDLEARHKLSFWDALIIHAAAASGADVLYSEDLSHGQAYGGLRVVNPLLP